MYKVSKLLFIILISGSFIACDSGDIYPAKETGDSGVSVTATFILEGVDAFPVHYNLLLGAYDDSGRYPLASKLISKPVGTDTVRVSLANLPDDTGSIRLSLVQVAGNKTVCTFYQYEMETIPDESFTVPEQKINLLSYQRVQKQIFSQCIQCHGGSGVAAAELNLTEDRSHAELVGITALNNPAKKRVDPGSILNSFIVDVLTESDVVAFNHSDLSTLKPDDVTLLKTWITAGAAKNK